MPIDNPAVDAGVGAGIYSDDTPVLRPDPLREYAAGGYVGIGATIAPLLPSEIDTITRIYGFRTYEAMVADPVVAASIDTLKMSVLSGGLATVPAVKPKVDKDGEAVVSPEAELAREIKEFCDRCITRVDAGFLHILFEMMDAMIYGHTLSERVCSMESDGEDAGRYSLKSMKVKPRWAYRFRVDGALNVPYVHTLTIEDGWRDIERSHFAVLTWDMKHNDPRGRSVLRACFDAWNLKRQVIPVHWKGVAQFGTPSLVAILPEDVQASVPTDSAGNPLPGTAPVDPGAQVLNKLIIFQAGSAATFPFGTKIQVVESAKDGTATRATIDMLDRQIVHRILLQVRATVESRNGSRADSQTGQDILGVLVRFLRNWLCDWIVREVLRPLVALNWGEAVARDMTPSVTLGSVEHQDFVAYAAAIASLFTAGLLMKSQMPAVYAMLGLPDPEPGDEFVGPQAVKVSPQPGQQDNQNNQNNREGAKAA